MPRPDAAVGRAMRVIVTRPQPDAQRWVQGLAQHGIDALALPLIEIRPLSDHRAVQAVWQACQTCQAIMFVSAAAVDHFFAVRPLGIDPWADATGPRCWATGPGTVAALARRGVPAGSIDAPASDSGQFDSEALWRLVGDGVRPQWQVVLVRGAAHDVVAGPTAAVDPADTARDRGEGRDWLADQLTQAGARVRFVVAYWRTAPAPGTVRQALMDNGIGDDALWLFTSTQAVRNLQACLPSHDWSRSRALASHPRIAAAARDAGFGVVQVSRPALDDLAASIKS